jgi:two-component system, NtrC family, sensor kinase
MRLVLKLTLAIAVAVTLITVFNTYSRVQRELDLFAADMRRDNTTVGNVTAEAARIVASLGGPEPALALLSYLHEHDARVFIHWQDKGAKPVELSHTVVAIEGVRYLQTEMPLTLAGQNGVLIVRNSMQLQDDYIRDTISQAAVRLLLTAAICTVIIGLLGWYLAGRPLRLLTARMRLVAEGHLDQPVRLRQRDEIGELAGEFDRMCERLLEARNRAEEETRARVATLEQLRHADRLGTVGQLAAGLAHELGTPLNVISVRAKMLLRGQSEGEEAREAAQILSEQADRMTRIIRQLLDFARRSKPRKERTDIRATAERAAALLEPLASRHRVSLTLQCQDDAVEAETDPEQIHQVITNLVMNAIQAQPNGGSVAVELESIETRHPELDVSGRFAKIRVADRGAGIKPEIRDQIFEPFFTTKEVGAGTGLGLSVAYGIVREHGGWIDVQSRPDEGSIFTVFVPAKGAP